MSDLTQNTLNDSMSVDNGQIWCPNRPVVGLHAINTTNEIDTLQSQVKAVSTAVSGAMGSADAAQSAADAAALDAASAMTALDMISSDGVLSSVEKSAVITDVANLNNEQAGIDAQAVAYGIITEKANYDGAITTLNAYLATLTTPTLWSDVTGNTAIDGPTFRSKFQLVYSTRQALLNAIYGDAKARADAAQSAADAAQSDATAAMSQLTNIASDNVLSSGEKSAVITDVTNIQNEQAGIDAQATIYAITTQKTAYDGAISALNTYLATLTSPTAWNSATGDTTIDGATFRASFQAVYAARQTLLNEIYALAKAAADAAQNTADQAAQDAADAKAAPQQVTGVSAVESPYKTQSGQMLSLVAVDYTSVPGDQYFAGVQVWFTGFNGSNSPQLIAEGNQSPVEFLCETTHEVVTVTVVATSAYGVAADFPSAPTCMLPLDGVVSAPPAPSIATAQVALAGANGWQFSFNIIGGLEQDLISGYRVYHSESNITPIPPNNYYTSYPQPSTNVGQIVVQETTQDIQFYWVSAYNAAGLESVLTPVPFVYVDPGDPAPPTPSPVQTTKTYAPTTLLNGWGSNGHVGYWEPTNSSYVFGLNAGTAYAFTNPSSAYDGNQSTAASWSHSHGAQYAGCVWSFASFAGLASGASVVSAQLSVVSEVLPTAGPVHGQGSVWYSTDAGATWTSIYTAIGAQRLKKTDTVTLSTSQNFTSLQVMAFAHSHDDLAMNVYEISLSITQSSTAGPEKVTGVVASLVGGNVQIAWNGLTPLTRTDISSYKVTRTIHGGGYNQSHVQATITPNGSSTYSWTDTEGHDGTWEYYVVANNSTGASQPSNAARLSGAQSMIYTSGETLQSLKPAQVGADVTHNNPSNGVTNGTSTRVAVDILGSINSGGGIALGYGTHTGTLPYGNHHVAVTTAINSSGSVQNLGGVTAGSITPIAGLMPLEAGAEKTTGKSLDILTDGTTYARVSTSRVNAGRPVVNLAESIHSNVGLLATQNQVNGGSLVTNGDFERGNKDNWSGLANSPTGDSTASAAYSYVTPLHENAIPDNAIPVNSNARYYFEARVKQASGSSTHYLGFGCYDANGNNIPTQPSGLTYNYGCLLNQTPPSSWTVYSGIISGIEASGDHSIAPNDSKHTSEWKFRYGTAYIRPVLLANYSGSGSIAVDYFKIAQLPQYGDSTYVDDLKPAESGAEKTTGKSIDILADGSTYARTIATRLSAGKPLIDFSEAIHLNKNIDNVGDGSTYARTVSSRLSSGKPLIDFSEAIHLNKHLGNVPDGGGRYGASEAGANVTNAHVITATSSPSSDTAINLASYTAVNGLGWSANTANTGDVYNISGLLSYSYTGTGSVVFAVVVDSNTSSPLFTVSHSSSGLVPFFASITGLSVGSHTIKIYAKTAPNSGTIYLTVWQAETLLMCQRIF